MNSWKTVIALSIVNVAIAWLLMDMYGRLSDDIDMYEMCTGFCDEMGSEVEKYSENQCLCRMGELHNEPETVEK